MPNDVSQWVTVATFSAVYEADLAVGILKGAGIPARVRAESTGIFGPGYVGTVTGGAAVVVPEDRAREAREILEDDLPEDSLPGTGMP